MASSPHLASNPASLRVRTGPGTVARLVRAVITRDIAQDAGIAALLLVAGILGYVGRVEVEIPDMGVEETAGGIPTGAITLIVGQTAPLIWRRIAPLLVLTVVLLSITVFFALSYFPSLGALGLLVALYTVAAHRERSVSVLAALVCGLVLMILAALSRQPFELEGAIGETLLLGAAWVLGDGVRERRSHVLLLEHRATSLGLERDQRAREAVSQERRIIARELHDVVAHNVSLIVAQAGAARHASSDDPQLLGSIEGLGREALTEMRRLTGFLRTDDDPVGWAQPGLADVGTLIEQVRAAGVPTAITIDGQPRPLSAGLSLSAYRIVQEALTNVLKHAHRGRAEVLIRYGPTRLELTIENDGATTDPLRARGGYGHVGMRERVLLYGGDLEVGPRPDGRYAVAVTLPLQEAAT